MQKILIINLGGIGDFLLSLPAVRGVKKRYPDAILCLLTTGMIAEVACRYNIFNNIYQLKLNDKPRFPLWKTFYNFMLLIKLRFMKFDLAINMRTLVSTQSARKMKILLWIIRPRTLAGRDTAGRGGFYDVRIPESDMGDKYEMEYDIQTVTALGIPVDDKEIDLPINNNAKIKAQEILKSNQVDKGKTVLIGLHPGGKPSHRWPIEQYAKLINILSEKIRCQFIVTGSKDENHLVKQLTLMTSAPYIDLTGQLNILETASIIKECDIFISNDTGPMHIAAILHTPLIAIFGPGFVTRFDPRNLSDKVKVLYKKIDCAPCNLVKCDRLECLTSISPEEVAQAVLELWKES